MRRPSRRYRQGRGQSVERLTCERSICNMVRDDSVKQTSYAAYRALDAPLDRQSAHDVRTAADHFDFDVDANLAVNSGSASDSLVSPMLAVHARALEQDGILLRRGPRLSPATTRGITTIKADPADGVTPAERVNPPRQSIGHGRGLENRDCAEHAVQRLAMEPGSGFRSCCSSATQARPRRAAKVSGAAWKLAAIWNPIQCR